jgi:hypothetical protein
VRVAGGPLVGVAAAGPAPAAGPPRVRARGAFDRGLVEILKGLEGGREGSDGGTQ